MELGCTMPALVHLERSETCKMNARSGQLPRIGKKDSPALIHSQKSSDETVTFYAVCDGLRNQGHSVREGVGCLQGGLMGLGKPLDFGRRLLQEWRVTAIKTKRVSFQMKKARKHVSRMYLRRCEWTSAGDVSSAAKIIIAHLIGLGLMNAPTKHSNSRNNIEAHLDSLTTREFHQTIQT
jgi:hypothetical protein